MFDRKDRVIEIEECTCEVDAEKNFLCDYCIAEIEWEKTSITDENGEVFSSVEEMKRVKTYRSLSSLQKMFDTEYKRGQMTEFAYKAASESISNLRSITMMMDILKVAMGKNV